MKIKKKRIIAFAPLLFSLIIIVLVILPSWQNIEEQKSAINENRVTRYDIEQSSQRTADLKSRSSELDEKIAFLNNKFIKSTQALDFITKIEDLAILNNILINVKTFNQPESASNEGDIELRVTGDLTKTVQYLFSLENLEWIIKTDSISLSRSISSSRETEQSNSEQLVSLDISAKVYWNNQ